MSLDNVLEFTKIRVDPVGFQLLEVETTMCM